MCTFKEIWPDYIDDSDVIRTYSYVNRSWNLDDPEVAVCFLAWNAKELTLRCLRKVVEHTDPTRAALYILDNGSEEIGMLADMEKVLCEWKGRYTLIRSSQNLFYSKGFNYLMSLVPGWTRYVVLCSSDCEPKSAKWLDYFIDALDCEGDVAGLVTSEVTQKWQEQIYRDRPIQYSDPVSNSMMRYYYNEGRTFQHVFQYCLMLRLPVLDRLGLYLERGRFYQHHSDWEWSMRMNALGLFLRNVTPDVHHHHQIAGLWACHRERYAEYMRMLEDPEQEQIILSQGRPLWETEKSE